ncbi:MAG: hypothetical protein ACQESR_30445 [Planctomycetota bacterium]
MAGDIGPVQLAGWTGGNWLLEILDVFDGRFDGKMLRQKNPVLTARDETELSLPPLLGLRDIRIRDLRAVLATDRMGFGCGGVGSVSCFDGLGSRSHFRETDICFSDTA